MPASIHEIFISSTILLFAATAGGWALTRKLAGEDAAISFFLISSALAVSMLVLQYVCWRAGRKRLLYQVLLRICLLFSFAWFLSSLLLPILWIDHVSVYAKTALIVFSFSIASWNMWCGTRHFREKWEGSGAKTFLGNYHDVSSSVDWNKTIRSLQLPTGMIVPSLPEKYNASISVLGLVGMLAGFELRSVFPIFSIFAWGVPASIMVAYLMYLMGIGAGEMIKIHELESQIKRKIAPIL